MTEKQTLRERILADTREVMRARDKDRLAVLRMVTAAVKQIEVDTRQVPGDPEVLVVLGKMLKQRRDSLEQFQKAGRDDLAKQESFEIEVIEAYMPTALDDAEIDQAIAAAVAESGAASMRDMGKVMGLLKSRLAGRADFGQVSGRVKQQLSKLAG